MQNPESRLSFFLPVLIILMTVPWVAEGKSESGNPESTYVIAGGTYKRSEVWEAFRTAQSNYGVDSRTGEFQELKKMGAVRLTGEVVRRSGSRLILKTHKAGLVSVMVRNGHRVDPASTTTFSLVKRSSSISERMAGGERVSMDQYTDVTLQPRDFLGALNDGKKLKGVKLKPVESRNERLKRSNRTDSGFDRRTIPVN